MNIFKDSFFINILIILCCIFSFHLNNVACDERKGIVKTYKNKYGDIFDCINIYQQPSLEHPLLKNHTIKINSSKLFPKIGARCHPKNSIVSGKRNDDQYCPEGTIPIIRSQSHNDIEILSSKIKDASWPPKETKPPPRKTIRPVHREYAHVRTIKGRHRVWGANATIQFERPYVIGELEYSMAHVMLVSNYRTPKQKSIEAGWLRAYKVFKEAEFTRFFVRWTDDGYGKTGCKNMQEKCEGFIQKNSTVKFGDGLPMDVPFINIEIYQDPNEKNWYLYKDCEEVGYWPNSLFTNLEDGFEQAIFGGEVSYPDTGYHTETKMGNGKFGTEGEGQAASINNIQIWTDLNDLQFYDLDEHEVKMNKPNCYNATVQNPNLISGGFSLYYGGPGFDEEICP